MEFWGPENLYEIFFGSEKNIFKENVSSLKAGVYFSDIIKKYNQSQFLYY